MALEIHVEKRLGSFTLAANFSCGDEPLAILGPSGAGKSMTLRCIAGLERPDRGSIVLNGSPLFDAEKRIDVPARRRGVGLLFQNYALFPHLTVAENIAFGFRRAAGGERRALVQKQLADVHLDGLADRFPRELSGGEQQRVALARALTIEPRVLLLDEPLSSLDTYLRSRIEQQLMATLGRFRRPALYVTHNIDEAYRIAVKMVVLSKGKVAASGSREEVFRRPPTLEVALLTGLKNFSRARTTSAGSVEALDWGCALRVAETAGPRPAYVGIRAHHIRFVAEESGDRSSAPNTFLCWLVRTSETQFNVTLHIRLNAAANAGESRHLQAEVSKENWALFKDKPQPWRVTLSPNDLLVLPE